VQIDRMYDMDAAPDAHPTPEALALLEAGPALRALGTSAAGLAPDEAAARLARHGRNAVADQRQAHPLAALLAGFGRPLPLLLLALAGLDLGTGQSVSAAVIGAIVVLSCLLGFVQEYRSQRAVQRLRALVRTEVQVVRPAPGGGAAAPAACPLEELVPGDIVVLAAGDLVPADLRFFEAVDLFVDQSALSGEALPVEKHARALPAGRSPDELANIGFMGTHVASGSARAMVIATGAATQFGRLAALLADARERTDFDRGIDRVVALLLRFMLAMAPLVLLLNWVTKGDLHQALLFSTAVAVGLAPEMLPMIVTVNLARGGFVESLLSQTLIVYVIRTGAAGAVARPAGLLVAASLLVCALGLWLPLSPLAPLFGFAPLPGTYWWGLGAILAAYAGLTLLVKAWLIQRFGIG
jgi:Mg2+-importing ATPase